MIGRLLCRMGLHERELLAHEAVGMYRKGARERIRVKGDWYWCKRLGCSRHWIKLPGTDGRMVEVDI